VTIKWYQPDPKLERYIADETAAAPAFVVFCDKYDWWWVAFEPSEPELPPLEQDLMFRTKQAAMDAAQAWLDTLDARA
jgi:hypothetical protein